MSDEEQRFFDAVTQLNVLGRDFYMDQSEYGNGDNTYNYSVLADANETQLSEVKGNSKCFGD